MRHIVKHRVLEKLLSQTITTEEMIYRSQLKEMIQNMPFEDLQKLFKMSKRQVSPEEFEFEVELNIKDESNIPKYFNSQERMPLNRLLEKSYKLSAQIHNAVEEGLFLEIRYNKLILSEENYAKMGGSLSIQSIQVGPNLIEIQKGLEKNYLLDEAMFLEATRLYKMIPFDEIMIETSQAMKMIRERGILKEVEINL